MVHQTILPGTHTSLTEVSISHLDCSAPIILPWLLLSSFLGEPLSLLVSKGSFLVLRSYNLESLSTLCYHLVPELLDVLQYFSLLLFFHKPLPFYLFLCFGLCFSSCFLSCMLYIMDLCCLFQTN